MPRRLFNALRQRRHAAVPALGLLLVAAGNVSAQSDQTQAPVVQRDYAIVPSFSATQTFTDNATFSATDRKSESITQLTPGISIRKVGGRTRGFFDYSLSGLVYGRDSDRNEFQQSLNGSATLEAIDNFAFVDVAGNISQRSVSAFGTQVADPTLGNPNQTEVSTLRISPYLRGRVGSIADYEARLTRSGTRSNAGGAFDSDTTIGNLAINGGTALSVLSWSGSALRQMVEFENGKSIVDLYRASLNYAATPELRFWLTGGHEVNDFGGVTRQSGNTYGVGGDWRPSERTTLAASAEKRLFGNAHSISFEHRTARTVWRFSDARDLFSGTATPTLGSAGTLFDQLFNLPYFATTYPNELERTLRINEYLRINNTTGAELLPGLTSAVTDQRAQLFSFAWLGLRDTLTVLISRNNSRALSTTLGPIGDFSKSNSVRQQGAFVSFGHRLTPQSSLDVNASYSKTDGDTDALTTTLKSLALGWSNQLGRRTYLLLSARHSRSSNQTTPYTENALTANLRFEF